MKKIILSLLTVKAIHAYSQVAGYSVNLQTVMPAYHDSTYYFRSFAANEFGYAASNVVEYTVP